MLILQRLIGQRFHLETPSLLATEVHLCRLVLPSLILICCEICSVGFSSGGHP